MKNKSLSVNVMLNIIKQCCAILFPLISFPYVSRVLGAENFGKVNFAQSITSYLLLLASLGITNYAIREASRIKLDKIKLQEFTEQVFTINLVMSCVSYICLMLLILCWDKAKAYQSVLLVQSISIILTALGMDWINSVFEDFFFITVRYVAFQILSICCLFLFVKDPGDYVLYAGIIVFASAGANIANLLHVRRYVKPRITFRPRFSLHILPMLMLFCNSLSVQIYVNSDITMLGIIQGDAAVGIYSVAVKIYNIAKQLLNAVIVVIIPRVSNLLGNGDRDKYNKLLDNVFHILSLLVLPAISGVFVLSPQIVLVIAGSAYSDSIGVLRILCLALYGAVFGNFVNNAILVPNKMEKYFLRGTIIAASVNLIANCILIPYIGYYGAAVTTLVAEYIVMGHGWIQGKRLCEFVVNKRDFFSCLVGCIAVGIVCKVITAYISNIFIGVLTSIVASVVVYICILYLCRCRYALFLIQKAQKASKGFDS